MSNAILIGTHPLRESLIKQYREKGFDVATAEGFDALHDVNGCSELCVLPQEGFTDTDILQALETFASGYPDTPEDQSKPLCHLLLYDKVTLWLLQTLSLYPEIHRKFELYAFTMEDQWAKNVFCGLGKNNTYPPLDREKIDTVSNKTVHLVIAGSSDLGESLALHAALVAHFPNYERDHSLRTRITIVDEGLTTSKDAFTQRYANLFEHSYYRCIDLHQQRVTQYHEPVYHATREDFVDVEWEFVDGNFYDPTLQRKLRLWSESKEQLLTIALCDKDDNTNFDRAFTLPKPVYENQIPILVQLKQSAMMEKVRSTDGYRNLYPIGMDDCGYDISLPLLQMAKRLNYFYVCSYGQRGTPTVIPADEVEREWRQLITFNMRYSNIFNVMTVATKMRSLGHEERDWDKFFALTQEEVEQLAAVEHNRWSVDRLILGWRPPTDTEREEIKADLQLKNTYKKKKVHYDLCAFRELDKDETGQDVRRYDFDLIACIPLIAQSFKETMS